MFGWMLVFALITIVAAILTVTTGAAAGILAAKFATFVFGFLFLACVISSLARGRA